ncbi:phosphatase PAP2 family protein [Mucilaginibacter sp. FT3.2]|uniref:phosphatase PAP2 family protein n=1 Tax=Mucilaginibacter sp. FT3.2 TaxID=2723090 RepID=UPI00160759AD|nr:phosphatase PAP2 family protein [Mucilaginibacter sp. FT3.2]MBB6234336.1 undecaprenyl-diphosphatase [Mucilaginibacter sp. FT3.2]
MPDYILQLDRHLFYFINHDLTNPFFDLVMPWLRNPKFWIPLYIFIIAFSLWKYRKVGAIIIVLLAATAGFADFTSGILIKHQVQRLRPCRDPVVAQTDISRVPCGSGYSFPSTHATDHFAMAIFLCLVFGKKWRWIWFWAILWAGLISFAQVYVGLHFPVDVVCGAIYGSLTGILFAYIFKKIQPSF